MANPLAVFRKYEKILLVVFGVALMIVFTVGGIVSQYMNRGAGASENEVVVTVDSEKIRESDLQNMRFARYHLLNFMRAVNQEAAMRGAQPQQGLGIPDTDGEEDLVQTAILARQAQDLGMQVSDEAIISSLARYSQGKLAGGDFARILNDVTQQRMSQSQFFDAMRREVLAQQYLGILQEGMMPPTPAGVWDYFQRLNRRLSFEAVPFQVSDYLARVEEPSEAQIQELYEEGKNRYAFPDRSDPGFKQPKRVAVQYVKADLATFMTEAKASITEEQIREYYDANQEEFRNIDLSTFESSPGSPESTPDSPSDDATPDPESGRDLSGNVLSDDDLTGDDLQDDDLSDDGLSGDDTPAIQPLQDDPEEDGEKQNSVLESDEDEVSVSDEDAVQQPSEVSNPPSVDETANEIEAEDVEAETPDATVENVVVDVAPEVDVADTAVVEDDPLADLPDQAGNNSGDRPEFKPLEEVAESIRVRLATPIARQKMDAALSAMRSEMKAYFGTYLAWDVSPDRDSLPKPSSPDLRPTAQQLGLSVGNIPLVTVFQLQETDPVTGNSLYEISRAYDTNYNPFAQYMFSDDLRMYEVRSIRGQVLDTEFLYWKTDEESERVPELDGIRNEVIQAAKMAQALELAKQDAQQAADQLNQSRQRPLDAYANDPNRKVVRADAVSWMTSMSVPYLPPRLTQITGISYPGDEFMRSTFSLSPGQAGIAVNQPKNIVYLVAVTQLDSDEEQLRQQFMRSGTTMETAQLARRDSQRHLQEWYSNLQKRLGMKWNRDPVPDSRVR